MDIKIEPFDNVTIKEEPLSLELNEYILNDKNKQKQMDNIDIKEETLNLNSVELHSENPQVKKECIETIFVQEGIVDPKEIDSNTENCENNIRLRENNRSQESTLQRQMKYKAEEKSLHYEEAPFKCELCPYTAFQIGVIKVHFKTHSAERTFKCIERSYCTTRKVDRETSTGKKSFRCDVYPYEAKPKSNINKKIRTYTGKRPFICRECSYCADRKSALEQHFKIHTGEKPFKCDICPYSSSRKRDVARHFQTHTGERPFKCELCPYRAGQKSVLKVHLRTHSLEKPFKCKYCTYCTPRKCDLDRHLKTHRL